MLPRDRRDAARFLTPGPPATRPTDGIHVKTPGSRCPMVVVPVTMRRAGQGARASSATNERIKTKARSRCGTCWRYRGQVMNARR